MKKIGIITFHNSYNCGSMLESYAIQEIIKKNIGSAEIIDFSSEGQKELYSVFEKNNSIKKIIKNILILPHYRRVVFNNKKYEEFRNKNFNLSEKVDSFLQLNDENYSAVVAGSDQIWNVTISDFNDAYLLPWVKNAKKIAYSPSFGAKNPEKFSKNKDAFLKMLSDFDALSVREFNGQKWIKNMINVEVPVLLDPTLLLEKINYEKIEDSNFSPNYKYLFFYSPSFNRDICKFVKKVAEQNNLKVVTWSTKSYYVKNVKKFNFILPSYESPSVYLNLIKKAELVLTTSYHGTIFSTIYRKKFFTIKNGGMFGDDDRVKTLLDQIDMKDNLISYNFDEDFDYLKDINYSNYDKEVPLLKKKSIEYLKNNLGGIKNEKNK